MSFISSISTSTWIALGAAGVGAGIGAKVAHDHDQSWALGAAIGAVAGFAGAKLVSYGAQKFNARLVKDAAAGAASLSRSPILAGTGGMVAGTTLADDLFRSVMSSRGLTTSVAAPAATSASAQLAKLLAANALPVATRAPAMAMPIAAIAAPQVGGNLAAILKAFVH